MNLSLFAKLVQWYTEDRPRWEQFRRDVNALVDGVVADLVLSPHLVPTVSFSMWPTPHWRYFDDNTPEYHAEAKRLFLEAVTAGRTQFPGMWEKGDSEYEYRLRHDIGDHVRISVAQARENVCTIVESETETEEVKVLDPSYYEAITKLKVAYTTVEKRPKKIIECTPLLKGGA